MNERVFISLNLVSMRFTSLVVINRFPIALGRVLIAVGLTTRPSPRAGPRGTKVIFSYSSVRKTTVYIKAVANDKIRIVRCQKNGCDQ